MQLRTVTRQTDNLTSFMSFFVACSFIIRLRSSRRRWSPVLISAHDRARVLLLFFVSHGWNAWPEAKLPVLATFFISCPRRSSRPASLRVRLQWSECIFTRSRNLRGCLWFCARFVIFGWNDGLPGPRFRHVHKQQNQHRKSEWANYKPNLLCAVQAATHVLLILDFSSLFFCCSLRVFCF